MVQRKLRKDHPMAGLSQAELMADATSVKQIENALEDVLTAHSKCSNRAKSLYGKRALGIIKLDIQECLKRVRAWDRKLEEAI